MLFQKSVIYINGDNVLITSIEEGTNNETIKFVKKSLALRDFISAIKASDQSITTKYFCQSAIKYEQTSNRILLHMFSPPKKVTLRARTNDGVKEYENASIPGYIMTGEFSTNGDFYGSKVRAVKNCYSALDIHSNTETYIMPFPNVYSGSDNVCWSSTLRDLSINLKNADLILNVFNTSVFNYDLFGPVLDKIVSTGVGPNTLDNYFEYLTKVDEFPEEFYFKEW